MLEGLYHQKSCFVGLTYAPEHLPYNGSLNYRDHTLFMKRLRARVYPTKIRFFAVGEYGETNYRPHFHYALFGIGKDSHDVIVDAWGKGIVHSGYTEETSKINADSAQYICGYITKKMALWSDVEYKKRMKDSGLLPERSWKSLKPGIGGLAVDQIVNSMNTLEGLAYIDRTGDIPSVLRHGKKNGNWPLGRYLKSQIRKGLGFENIGAQEGWYEKAQTRAEEEMLELCISQGLIGLIKKELEDEACKAIRRSPWGVKKELLRRANLEKTLKLQQKEFTEKRSNRLI